MNKWLMMYGINKELQLHFIGIGGIGMSGIAEVLLNLGYKVSGSDLGRSPVVARLESLGAKVYVGHKKDNVKEADIVIYSSAVTETNPEFIGAKEKRIPIIKRAEMLAELMRLKFGIAVAGSHGKTTTTSFLATILSNLNFQPTFIVGGVVKNLGSNAGLGKAEYLVAEADESDGSFLYLNPIISVITNIDNDHLDYYKTEEALLDAFVSFANKVPFYGHLIINGHDTQLAKSLDKLKRPFVTFGIKGKELAAPSLDYTASELKKDGDYLSFMLETEGDKNQFKIKMHGEHNALNAVGAIIVAHKLGASFKDIAEAIIDFEGVSRRLETLRQDENIMVIDDYGHHPTEIDATLNAIKNRYEDYEINVIFEPHRFSRSKNHWDEFVDVLTRDFKVYILPIYAASEEPIAYIDSEIMVKNINEAGGNASYIENLDDMKEHLLARPKDKKLYLTLGAGSISRLVREIL
ncbi:MAG: UDP-N-acetylmuramate--L-alanine ligase [Bacteriovoracaceae bacterium]|nr:UDP-N-acetylmuramate--L-alanine ligase [Bacteriovoracaceae bacterium]